MELIKTFSPQQYEDAMQSWQWIGLTGKTPILSSLFGDLFLESDDGYWFLDSMAGALTRDWDDGQAMENDLSGADAQDRYLLASLAATAEREGLVLGADEVYDLKHPPALGGALDVTNVSMLDFGRAGHLGSAPRSASWCTARNRDIRARPRRWCRRASTEPEAAEAPLVPMTPVKWVGRPSP